MPGQHFPARILVVEDDTADAELLTDQLRADGFLFEYRLVDDEAGFRRALTEFQPHFVMSDLAMPGFSGYRALEIVRETTPDVPFIFVSGTIGEEAAIEALKRGATDFVLKNSVSRLPSVARRALSDAADRAARERTEIELMRAQRYESLALLAGGFSHDLRNILQPLLIASSMIEERDDPKLHNLGLLIGDCARRGLEMVASMLSFARGSRSGRERVRISALFDALALLLQGSVPRNVKLRIDKGERDFELDGNHTELQQCLLNLCLNALQAMPAGGSLTLSVEHVELGDDFFAGDEERATGAYLKLAVADTGIGMSEEVRGNLFKPFFTTKEDGTGLGLLSCKRILANHRGFMRIETEPGKGTTFNLYLPLPSAVEAPEGDFGPAPRGAGERVLIVVEEIATLTLLGNSLGSYGYDASMASSGTLALQTIDADALPALVVMDADMSLMTGVRTLSALLERGYRGPVLLLVRPDAPPEREGLPPLERIRFIEKPVVIAELARVVREERD
ncbi:MAG TPA: response regulator, partial [Rhodanobacteraceae bacterium]|nr:response regulator [Rhodanobacteraceae bacterium]